MLSNKQFWLAGMAVSALVAAGAAWGLAMRRPFGAIAKVDPGVERQIEDLVAAEELILKLTPELPRLGKGFMNFSLPDSNSVELFATQVEVADLLPEPHELHPEPAHSLNQMGVRTLKWDVAAEFVPTPCAELALWKPLLAESDYFQFARFYFIKAEFADAAHTALDAEMGCEGLVRTATGAWRSYKGKQQVVWRAEPSAAGEEPRWQIASWRQLEFKSYDRQRLMFEEVTAQATAPDLAARLRSSAHEQKVIRAATHPDEPPPTKYFNHIAFDRHPGVSVVDLDRDGFDDLYVMDQWGKNVLLHNQGDGRFVDLAPQTGLDLDSHCTSALFADFDNDGDADAFIGRSLERTVYLVNDEGRFSDRGAELVSAPLPYLASSLAAADFNRDGLLDIYISTYAADTIDQCEAMQQQQPDAGTARTLLAEFLPRPQAEELFRRWTESHHFKRRVGPPNVLLINRGGRFEPAPASEALAVWRNTYQSTWGDYDGDGYADLYVANDFSPNNLFHNNGDGTFTDVTDQTQTADIGFGMGAAWGDYDNDGRSDLYVTNMYSKAGNRIAGAMQGQIDADTLKMAGGNTLFRNEPARFEKVSGLTAPKLTVEMAGWSWGGQFIDVNNDGYLDIFATSGYYSAPPEVAVEIDL